MTHWMDPDSSQWKCQEQWKVVNEKGWAAMKSGQWKGLACNEKYPMKMLKSNEKPPMKYPGLQWKVLNENSWPAMKSSQWKGLASNEKRWMKIAGLQWKAANDKLWPAMKSYWKAQGLLWKNLHHKRAWDPYDILFIKVCGAMHIIFMAWAMVFWKMW